jgi:hypothetical protein
MTRPRTLGRAPPRCPRPGITPGGRGRRGLPHGRRGRVDGSPSRNLGVNEIYDPATDTWSDAVPLPTPRSGVASAVLGTGLYVFGGESGSRVFDEVEAYDLAANRWRRLAGMPTARHGFGAVSFEGRIFTITGSPRPGGGGSRIVEVFKP